MNRVKELRRKSGLSQERLAKMAGISRPYLSHVESGLANPTVDKASSIAKALGQTVDDTFPQQDHDTT